MGHHYVRGLQTERRMIEELREEGYAITRAAASKGNWDVIAVGSDHVLFISCKRSANWKNAKRTYTTEKKRLQKIHLPGPNNIKLLAMWTDELEDGRRLGTWFCREVIE